MVCKYIKEWQTFTIFWNGWGGMGGWTCLVGILSVRFVCNMVIIINNNNDDNNKTCPINVCI